MKIYQLIKLAIALLLLQSFQVSKIDRKKVVQRHNVFNTKVDILNSLTVGNGTFAYTVDVTGMQSFPEYYRPGVSLGTQSEWAWDSFRSEEHTSELQSRENLVCRLLLDKKNDNVGGYSAT